MSTTREIHAEAATDWAEHARKSVAEAIFDTDTALSYCSDGVHRRQLTTAREALARAAEALAWVKP